MDSSCVSARQLALRALQRIRRDEAFASPVIARLIDQSTLPKRERGFAAMLVKGVVTYQGVLDETLDRFLRKPKDVKPSVRDALRESAFELLILEKSPHAAVNEGVNLVRGVESRASGLANAVLRRVADVAPQFPFGDPATSDEAAARLCAMPLWLFRRIAADRGRAIALAFGEASLKAPPLFLALRDDSACERLKSLGESPQRWVALDDRPPDCYQVSSAALLTESEAQAALNAGEFIVADGASQLTAALALPAEPPRSFLEVGCGRGTKTLLLNSDALKRYGSPIPRFVALDNQRSKLEIARRRCVNAGFDVVTFVEGDGGHLDDAFPADERFDAIFIDAPCSGIGTLRRHPEIRWRVSEETIAAKADVGFAMLRSAARRLGPGGLITYATCTITREENENVLERFLKSDEGTQFRCLPTGGQSVYSTLGLAGVDGHTLFRLRKLGD